MTLYHLSQERNCARRASLKETPTKQRPIAADSNVSLAVFVESRAEVDLTVAKALLAGATLTSAARTRDGDLYSAYFDDPEGNSWEVVWAPRFMPPAGS
jgi:uncharacterized protein